MIPPAETVAAPRAGAFSIAAYALLVVVAWAGLELWGLGKEPFHTKGEPREALVVWEMTHGGGWILPRRNGMELPSKPPLFHWLGALTSLAHGDTDEWSIRFPSAALSLMSVLCVFAAGAALWNARTGLLSALTLLTMFEWARAATGARVDMTLTFGLQVAFLSLLFFLRSRAAVWLVALYLGITLAVLGKGPVGVALPALVGVVMIALTRDLTALRRMRLGTGVLIVGVLAGSWYVLALILGGYEFFRKQVLAENLFTFVDNPDFGSGGHRHAASYLLGALLLGVLPWTIFLPAVVGRLWRDRRALTLGDARVYLLVWITAVFAFYAVAASKRGVYLLALYPALALLLGWWWDEHRGTAVASERWLVRLLLVVGWGLMGTLGLTVLVVLAEGLGAPVCTTAQRWLPAAAQPVAPWISDTIRAGRWPLLGFLLLAGGSLYACIRAARAERWMAIFAALFMTVAAVLSSVRQVILPGIAQHQSLRPFIADVRHVVGPTADLFFYKAFEYGAVFYWQGHIPIYEGSWPADGPRYLLMQQGEWEQTPVSARGQYERVALPSDGNSSEPERLVLVRRVEAQ